MINVILHGAEFFARHGFYPEEKLLGSKFLVDISVGFTPASELNADDLTNTVNYEELYAMVCLQMQRPKKLIETLAQAILDEIKEQYPYIETIQVTIKKLNPPLKGKVGYSAVNIAYNKPQK
jgi:7,8-dihydroneopterin aldolase/epimerase/oxygenase